jgi:hypothetical protein
MVTGMNTLIQIPTRHAERILAQIDRDHPVYSIVKNGLIFKDPRDGSQFIKILCDESSTETLLDAAKKLCPEATAAIEESISRSRMP